MRISPITQAQAKDFISQVHRHHKPPTGWKYGIGVRDEDEFLRGVITVGRPVARTLDDGLTLEVTRCATDGSKNAVSMLYGAAWRVARSLGYIRMLTYVLEHEHGSSLKASGWRMNPEMKGGGDWSNGGTRNRLIDHDLMGPKHRWEIGKWDV